MSVNLEIFRSFETTVEMSLMGEAAPRLNNRTYWGKLLFGREAATIEVRGEAIVSTLRGDPDHENKILHMMVEIHREKILDAVRPLAINAGDTIVIAGLWNDTLPFLIEIFEPHIVHVVSSDGAVRSRAYNLGIFPWDNMAHLAEDPVVLRKRDGVDAHFALYTIAEDYGECVEASAMQPRDAGLAGVIWYPDANTNNLPIIICRIGHVPTYGGVRVGSVSGPHVDGPLH